MQENKEKKISQLPSLAVAIPAHNEEGVIFRILESLHEQCFNNCKIEKIVVYCDGCSDNTIDEVREFMKKSSIISFYEGKERIGKTKMLNRIFCENESDFLLILDADIGLDGKYFIQRFIEAVVNDSKNVMFAAHQIPLRPKSIIGRIFHASFLMWDYVRLSLPNKDHVENFYGAATIYRKSFTKKIFIPAEITGMRTYLYLLAKNNGGFSYIKDVSIKYWPPHTISDFMKLTKRVYGSDLDKLEKIFGKSSSNVYLIDRKYKIKGVLEFAKKNPLYLLPALITSFLLIQLTRRYQKKHFMASGLWEKAISTKKFTTSIAKKRCVIFSNYDDLKNPWYGGGGALAIHEVAKRLVDTFEVKVITGKYPNYTNTYIDRVYYKRIGVSFLGPKIGQLIYSLVLPFYVSKEKFEIWFESFTPPFTTGLLPFFTKKPVIGVTHMLGGKDMYRKYGIPFHFFEHFGLKFYDRFVALSDMLKNEIKKYNQRAIVDIIPNGVDLQTKLENRNLNKNIVFIGRIEINQKGLDLLLNAFNKINLPAEHKLLIAGSGEKKEEEWLKNKIGKLNNDRIEFIGRIEGENKKNFLKKAIFLIIPSRFESFSLVALEAFSYGLPVIVFNLENLKWISPECAIKVKPFDEDELARAIEKLIIDPELRMKMGDKAWEFSKDFSWDSIGKKYLDYINNVLKV